MRFIDYELHIICGQFIIGKTSTLKISMDFLNYDWFRFYHEICVGICWYENLTLNYVWYQTCGWCQSTHVHIKIFNCFKIIPKLWIQIWIFFWKRLEDLIQKDKRNSTIIYCVEQNSIILTTKITFNFFVFNYVHRITTEIIQYTKANPLIAYRYRCSINTVLIIRYHYKLNVDQYYYT